jgi:hypothetical protein
MNDSLKLQREQLQFGFQMRHSSATFGLAQCPSRANQLLAEQIGQPKAR